jgi:hypothetical protein
MTDAFPTPARALPGKRKLDAAMDSEALSMDFTNQQLTSRSMPPATRMRLFEDIHSPQNIENTNNFNHLNTNADRIELFPAKHRRIEADQRQELEPLTSYQTQYLQQQIKYLESQLTSIRAEQQLNLARKDSEIAGITAAAMKQHTELQKMHSEREGLANENKILKRAVAIQDGKLKELQEQNQRLQDCVRAAMEKLQEFDQANRALQFELNLLREGRGYGNFPPQPPPDVY